MPSFETGLKYIYTRLSTKAYEYGEMSLNELYYSKNTFYYVGTTVALCSKADKRFFKSDI